VAQPAHPLGQPLRSDPASPANSPVSAVRRRGYLPKARHDLVRRVRVLETDRRRVVALEVVGVGHRTRCLVVGVEAVVEGQRMRRRVAGGVELVEGRLRMGLEGPDGRLRVVGVGVEGRSRLKSRRRLGLVSCAVVAEVGWLLVLSRVVEGEGESLLGCCSVLVVLGALVGVCCLRKVVGLHACPALMLVSRPRVASSEVVEAAEVQRCLLLCFGPAMLVLVVVLHWRTCQHLQAEEVP